MKMRFRFLSSVALALTAASVGAGCEDVANNTGMTTTPQPSLLQIQTVSNRADHISGGDAMVQIILPPDVTIDGLHVKAGDRDVTSEFAARADGRILGVIHGLAEGDNKITADVGGSHTVSLTITNHSLGGPVFSGDRVTPFICATPKAVTQSGDTPASNASGLTSVAVAGDDNCNLKTEVKLFYRSTDPACQNVEPDPSPDPPPATACFKPFDPSAPAPADLAMVARNGGMVPYIVRDERGTINRGIYDIVVLFDPKADSKDTGWKPFAPQKGWNGKVLYSFGASSGQPRLQFRSEQHWNAEDSALSQGYMVAFNSMTDSLYNSNRTLMTETVMMMKEKIIDNYGEVTYVVGNGCSGGSINQLTTASIYPGLLDGVQPTCTYPDSESTAVEVVDCLQLVNAFSSAAWAALHPVADLADFAKRAAIAGHLDARACITWVLAFADGGRPGQFVPRAVNLTTGKLIPPPDGAMTKNNCGLPESMVYNKDTNPKGIRCGAADNAVAIFGTVKDGSRALGTTDNVGVQYGLKALTDGAITPEEFVVVNEQAGGVDADANLVAERTAADEDALDIAYRAGIVSDGSHLAKLPILDTRGYDESGIHQAWRSLALRARIDDANKGKHDNLVLWRHQLGLALAQNNPIPVEALSVMDEWLTAIKADTSGGSIEKVVVASKPKDAFDFCYLTTDTMLTTKVTDIAMCDADARLKMHASPRQIAGGPVSENIIKCQLKPLDLKDYAPAVLSDAQFNRLKKVFPDGVCDFSKPGVGQTPAESPLNFAPGPGGVPFGAPPATKSGG